jgi:hypothetical protein
MEHNEYAVWRAKVRHKVQVRQPDGMNGMELVGTQVVEEELLIVAPKGSLGRALLAVHFAENTSWKYGGVPLDNGKKVEVLELDEQKLSAIIQYDDEYRGRM